MIAIRVAKTVLVAAMALFASLVAFGNITDYSTNFAFVQHVLSMDTIFPFHHRLPRDHQSRPAPRGLCSHHRRRNADRRAVLDRRGAVRASLRAMPHSTGRKRSPSSGLTLGFLLWQVGFMSIAGEWFGMWQSQPWNGVPSAFRLS